MAASLAFLSAASFWARSVKSCWFDGWGRGVVVVGAEFDDEAWGFDIDGDSLDDWVGGFDELEGWAVIDGGVAVVG